MAASAPSSRGRGIVSAAGALRIRGRCRPRAAPGTRRRAPRGPSRRSRARTIVGDDRAAARAPAARPPPRRRSRPRWSRIVCAEATRSCSATNADRERQQRVQVEEVFAGVVPGGRQRADGDRQHQRRALADAQQHPEGAAAVPASPGVAARTSTAARRSSAGHAVERRRPARRAGAATRAHAVTRIAISSRLPLCNTSATSSDITARGAAQLSPGDRLPRSRRGRGRRLRVC